MTRLSRLLACLLLLALPAAAADREGTPLPVDPQVRFGVLDNGLRYAVRANARPAARAELRLVVDAGSVLEEDDQRGLAHFLEHMAFNGTENHPPGELVDFLESIGSRFGPDINAYTSFDETVYMLQLPTDTEGLLDTGLEVLRDWASRMTLDPAEIEKERGVVLEEWRRGQGASQRIRQKTWPVIFSGSLYADRLPIGLPEVIETAPPERIRAFYERWYRPDLMAVVAVGDFDPADMEARIRELFSDIPAAADPEPRPVIEVPSHEEARAVVATDPEQAVTLVTLGFKHPRGPEGRVEDYRRGLVSGLFGDMLDARLAEITRRPDAPFRQAGSGNQGLSRTTEMFGLVALTEGGKAEAGLVGLATEIARIRAHGFTAGELERSKAELAAAMENAYQERDKTESGSLAAELVRHFLEGEPVPGIAAEYELVNGLLPGITLDDVNGLVGNLVHDHDTVITLSAPEGSTTPLPGELIADAEAALAATPDPYVDTLAGTALLAELPEPGELVSTSVHEELGVTEYGFANGLTVRVKPTDFKNDEILFRGTAIGGLSTVDPGDYVSASLIGGALSRMGWGGHSPTDLQKLLAGKLISVFPTIQDFQQGVNGSTAPGDLEAALQMVYLVMTEPNRDEDGLAVFRNQVNTALANRENLPDAKFGDRVQELTYGDNYMEKPLTLERFAEFDLDAGLAAYRRLYSDASDFVFTFVGAIDPEEALPLFARYLGSLPSRNDGPGTIGDPGLAFPPGTVREEIPAGREPKATTVMAWPAPASMDEMEMFRMRMASDILEIRLREILREELGGTYSVGVGYRYTPPYRGYAATLVTFGSSPGNAASMSDVVFDEIAKFKESGPTPEEVAKVQEIERRAVETGLRENSYWLGSLATLTLLEWDLDRVLHRLDRIDTLTPEGIHETFDGYFPTDQWVVATQVPETPAGDGED